MSKSDLDLKKISDYIDSIENIAKRSVSGDSKESKRSGSNSDDGDNDSLSVPYLARWHTTKSDKIIEGDLFKYKGKVIENVHPYIIPTVRETKMDYLIMFEPYTDEDLGGNPVGVRIGDDDSSSTTKDEASTSSPEDLHKHIVALEEAVLNIAAYIREKRLKKKKWISDNTSDIVHVDLCESDRNEEGAKKSKMDELASVESQEEGEKVVAAEAEEEATADEQEGEEKVKTVEQEADKANKEDVEKEAAGEQKEEAEEETTAACEEREEVAE
ncbi:neurofilament medium polypeptide-like [Capsicum annuum]|uniref:neurofilament medium polypeptide-like n=1 Tax=Capsicum annuum TaxID=4072 RepID=UPI001FB19142|nr:neurofilament medium polypeptide-like [Capsicum annuum]